MASMNSNRNEGVHGVQRKGVSVESPGNNHLSRPGKGIGCSAGAPRVREVNDAFTPAKPHWRCASRSLSVTVAP
jgi:hypothetical protein